MKKFAELQYQIEGLKNSIAKMEYGIENDDVRYIKAELRYVKEKSERILDEAKIVVNQENNE